MTRIQLPRPGRAILACSVFLLNFIHGEGTAQTSVHGSVVNARHEAAANASVLLLKASDSSLVKAVICDKNGAYLFIRMGTGTFRIAANAVGFRQAYSAVITIRDARSDEAIAQLVLEPDTAQLQQVTVAARKPLIEQTLDQLVIKSLL